MSIAQAYLAEFEQENKATRICLERVPEGQLNWGPHGRSMTLGRLSWHLATIPKFMLGIALPDSFDFATLPREHVSAQSVAELLAACDENAQYMRDTLPTIDDARMMQTWTVLMDGKEFMALPRVAMIRSFLLNHWIHHRGQLSVYLRLLDVPVPSIYGPSADENPFG